MSAQSCYRSLIVRILLGCSDLAAVYISVIIQKMYLLHSVAKAVLKTLADIKEFNKCGTPSVLGELQRSIHGIQPELR